MIVTRLNGGLGNQLFQYAMGRRTAEVTGQTLKLDTEKFKTCSLRDYRLIHFNIEATIATQVDKRRLHILRRQDPLALIHYLLDKLRPAHLDVSSAKRTSTFNQHFEILMVQPT